MSHRESTQIWGVRCDHPKCDGSLEGEDVSARFDGRNYWDQAAVDSGWTIWFTSRREHRCPKHPVKSGKARLVAGRPGLPLIKALDGYCAPHADGI